LYGIESVSVTETTGEVSISLKNEAGKEDYIKIISVSDGSIVSENKIQEREKNISIRTADLGKGIYTIVYTMGNNVMDQKNLKI